MSTPIPSKKAVLRGTWCCNFWFTLGAVTTGLYALFAYGFLVESVVPLGGSVHPRMREEFALEKPAIIIHAICSGLALMIGPLQVIPTFRGRIGLPSHRILGRVYILLCVAGSITSIIVAQRAQGGLAGVIGFTVLGSLWLCSTVVGLAAVVMYRNLFVHELAMQVSCALSYSAPTLRLLLPIAIFTDFQLVYGIISWLCWIINLAVLALIRYLQWRTNDEARAKSPSSNEKLLAA
jgi:uncharacterized membrane protein